MSVRTYHQEKLEALIKELQFEAWEEGWRAGVDHSSSARNPYR